MGQGRTDQGRLEQENRGRRRSWHRAESKERGKPQEWKASTLTPGALLDSDKEPLSIVYLGVHVPVSVRHLGKGILEIGLGKPALHPKRDTDIQKP